MIRESARTEFLHRPRRNARRGCLISLGLAAFILALLVSVKPMPAGAQTLARPGWVGSGLTTQAWFKHAIFYQIDPRTFQDSDHNGAGDLRGITQHIDYIHSLGVDAILLESLGTTTGGSPSTPIDPSLGSLDDFDELTRQASRLKIRILLTLPAPDPALARFWLTRGVAGFYIPGNVSALAGTLQVIRKLLPTYVGQRVLITDADPNAIAHLSSNELSLDRATFGSAANLPLASEIADLHSTIDRSQVLGRSGPLIFAIASGTSPAASLPKVTLAAVLLNRSAALITAGQELGLTSPSGSAAPMPWGIAAPAAADEVPAPAKPTASVAVPDKYTPYVPYVRPEPPKKAAPPDPNTVAGQEALPDSLLSFYRRLSLLHHSAAIHDGDQVTLDHDAQGVLVWVRKPTSPSPFNSPTVVACNLSAKSALLSLAPDMARLQLRGNFLRTLLRSDDAMGGTSIDRLTVPADGVYVGQLRY